MINNTDITIIGNGILGVSTAFRIYELDPKLKICLIGPESNLNGATTAAGAMLGVFGEITEATEKSKPAMLKLEMALQSKKLWPEWVEKINNNLPNENKLKINYGTHIILNSQASKRETRNFNTIIKFLNKYNCSFEEVSPDEISGLNPLDNYRPLRSIYIPSEGFINAVNLLDAFKSINQQYNIFKYLNSTAVKLKITHDKHGNNKKIIMRNGDIINAKNIVIAAGAYSKTLIQQLPQLNEQVPPLFAGVGCSIILKHHNSTLKHAARTPNRGGSCGAQYLPYDKNNNLVYLGASNSITITPKIYPELYDTRYLMQWGYEQFDQYLSSAEILQINIGNRPVTIDTFPLIGATNLDGVSILTGTFRDGLHDSPLLADIIANEILFGKKTFNNLFAPIRKPIKIYSKQESIAECYEHYLSTAYETNINFPYGEWKRRLEIGCKAIISKTYDQLDTNYGIPPEILFMLCLSKTEKNVMEQIKTYLKTHNF